MNNSNATPNDEEVMLAFSVEPNHDPVTIQRYIENYPHLASELLDLALDLRMLSEEEPVTLQDVGSSEIQRAWDQFNGMISAERSELTAEQIKQVEASLISIQMREIGRPSSMQRANKPGQVALEGVPGRRITKIASTGGYAAFLSR